MNILFIGMPGAGKTTICSLLSKKMDKNFIEIDKIIESEFNMKLQAYIDTYENEAFKKEGEIILNILKTTKNGIIFSPRKYYLLSKSNRLFKKQQRLSYYLFRMFITKYFKKNKSFQRPRCCHGY